MPRRKQDRAMMKGILTRYIHEILLGVFQQKKSSGALAFVFRMKEPFKKEQQSGVHFRKNLFKINFK